MVTAAEERDGTVEPPAERNGGRSHEAMVWGWVRAFVSAVGRTGEDDGGNRARAIAE